MVDGWTGEIKNLNFFLRSKFSLHFWDGLNPFGRAGMGSNLTVGGLRRKKIY